MPARTSRRRDRVPRLAGLALTALGVPLYPLIGPLVGRDWSQAEVFGIHPDPTAVATLGVALLTLRGYRCGLVGHALAHIDGSLQRKQEACCSRTPRQLGWQGFSPLL